MGLNRDQAPRLSLVRTYNILKRVTISTITFAELKQIISCYRDLNVDRRTCCQNKNFNRKSFIRSERIILSDKTKTESVL